MREIVTHTTVYKLDELSDDAQQKAIDGIRERLGGAWWDSSDNDDIRDTMQYALAENFGTPGRQQYGIADYPGIPGVSIDGWDLDRGQSLVLAGTLDRANAPKLPWVDGIGAVKLEARRDHTYITVEDDEPECTCPDSTFGWPQLHQSGCPTVTPSSVTDAQRFGLKEAVLDVIRAAWRAGEQEMEYKTSSEYAREWIEANETEFTEDGSLYS